MDVDTLGRRPWDVGRHGQKNWLNILWNFRDTDLSNINKLSIPVSPYELDDGRQVLIISENFTKYAASKGLKNS